MSTIILVSTENHRPVWNGAALIQRVPRGLKNPLCLKMAARFRRAREENQVTRFRLSAIAGLSNNHAAKIEDGQYMPTIQTLESFAAALGVSPGWLAYGPEGSEPFRERAPRPFTAPAEQRPADRFRSYKSRHAGFPERLRASRESCGVSMRSLASAAGISVQSWSNAESGKTVPRIDTAERMAVALGVAPSWLSYGYDEDAN